MEPDLLLGGETIMRKTGCLFRSLPIELGYALGIWSDRAVFGSANPVRGADDKGSRLPVSFWMLFIPALEFASAGQ